MIVVTITTQRSGSKLFGGFFNCGTQIRSIGEVFNPDRSSGLSFRTFVETHTYSRLLEKGSENTLDWYFDEICRDHGSIHIDLMFNQLEFCCLSWNPFSVPFIYGYLVSREAVIISLERSIRDSFVSGKYLELSGMPHRLRGQSPQCSRIDGRRLLDVGAFLDYQNTVHDQRQSLLKVTSSYKYFVRVQFSEIAETLWLPSGVKDLLIRHARDHHEELHPGLIQLHVPRSAPTGVDYREVFENYDALDSDL
jgi:hypothetical protein